MGYLKDTDKSLSKADETGYSQTTKENSINSLMENVRGKSNSRMYSKQTNFRINYEYKNITERPN